MGAVREKTFRAALAVLGLLLGSCAATFNEPINLPVASNAAIVPLATPPNVGGNTVVALAFSGGGTRAAAFAYGAMRGLDRLPASARGTYFDRVIFISGVSGGSVAAAYFGLKGRAALSDFRERFLLRNAEEDLNTNVSLVNLRKALGEESMIPRGWQAGSIKICTRELRWPIFISRVSRSSGSMLRISTIARRFCFRR